MYAAKNELEKLHSDNWYAWSGLTIGNKSSLTAKVQTTRTCNTSHILFICVCTWIVVKNILMGKDRCQDQKECSALYSRGNPSDNVLQTFHDRIPVDEPAGKLI